MKKLKGIRALNDIDESFIEEASPENEPVKKGKIIYMKWAGIAATFIVVALAGAAVLNSRGDKGLNSGLVSSDKSYESGSADVKSGGGDISALPETSKPGRDVDFLTGDAAGDVESDGAASGSSDSYLPLEGEIGKDVKSSESKFADPGEAGEAEDPYGSYTNGSKQADVLLTAGRWKDNSNWGFFINLVNTEAISFPAFGLYPMNRIAVHVTDESQNPVSGLRVEAEISSSDDGILQAVTGKDGFAYLFTGQPSQAEEISIKLYDENGDVVDSSLIYAKGSKDTENIQGSQVSKISINEDVELVYKGQRKAPDNTQVMFIIDTTGSMGDELTYLQMDFAKIVEDVDVSNVSYSFNFYRDEGDDYVTKTNPFSSDIGYVQSLLNRESAEGGGDYPEAVDQILDETINSEEWSDSSAKIAFLVFDAPPHDGTEERIVAAVRTAAAKGIHIVPVIASDSDRATELFGRALAIMTNGEYVFITDDSGIGNSHLEPIIGDYEVEKLHDIIVDIIRQYS